MLTGRSLSPWNLMGWLGAAIAFLAFPTFPQRPQEPLGSF